MIAAICCPHHPRVGGRRSCAGSAALGADERGRCCSAYVGDRNNRRHRPGRAFERTDYRFDVVDRLRRLPGPAAPPDADHRVAAARPALGYDVPDVVEEAGVADRYSASLERSRELYEALAPVFPVESAYAVALAFRIRYSMQMNAREAMHVIELRSGPQGHPAYRWVAQEMHRRSPSRPVTGLLAEACRHVDYGARRSRAIGVGAARRGRRAARGGRNPAPP